MSLSPISSSPPSAAVTRGGVGLDDPEFAEELVKEALVWCVLHGLVVGDRSNSRSGTTPGVGMVHAPFSLLPVSLPSIFWQQACDVAPLFNELVDKVSLDAEFLQNSLSRTKKVDDFTGRLLDIHLKMLSVNKKEDIRLGLHRSDYMVDSETNMLLQIELNSISSSFPGLGSLVSQLYRNILKNPGETLGLDYTKVPENTTAINFAEALYKAWLEYRNKSAVIMIIVQAEGRNMYDQYWLTEFIKDKYPFILLII